MKNFYKCFLKNVKNKKYLVRFFTLLIFIIVPTLILYFILPDKYKSEATLMPVTPTSNQLGSLADLASLAGFNIGSNNDVNKIMAVLNSKTLKKEVVQDLNLIDYFFEGDKSTKREVLLFKSIEMLTKKVNVEYDSDKGIIILSSKFKNPNIAQKVLERYIEIAQKILNEKSLTVAKFNRVFLEKKLKSIEDNLFTLQKKLASFQKKTKLIAPDKQMSNILDLVASYISKKIDLLLELSSLESTLSKDNPKVKILKKEISYIDKQLKKIEKKNDLFPGISQLPSILEKYYTILRDIKVNEELYEVFMKLYQQARLNESKQQIFVEVIDPPYLPYEPDNLTKILLLLIGVIISFSLSSIVFIKNCI